MNGKKKNSLLIIAFVISIFIAYQLAFSKTLKLRKDYILGNKEAKINRNINNKLTQLSFQKKFNDSILKSHRYSLKGSFQTNLLHSINTISNENNIKVIQFLEPQVFLKGDAIYTNYQISLKGSYHDILKLLYTLEEENKFGKLISVNFSKKRNYKTSRNYLIIDFILQRVE